jgi:hypothetical protein
VRGLEAYGGSISILLLMAGIQQAEHQIQIEIVKT